MTEFFTPYAFVYRPVDVYPAYWNPETKKFTPLSKAKQGLGYGHETHEVLDSLTLAVEAGVVPKAKWVKFLFGTKAEFLEFVDELGSYDECYRITDRWWTALAMLAGTESCEEGFVSSQEIADVLTAHAQESGQV